MAKNDLEDETVNKEIMKDINREDNSVGVILRVIGWLILLIGFIMGFVIADTPLGFSFLNLIYTWFACGLFALTVIGFSEIIIILHDIRRKIYMK